MVKFPSSIRSGIDRKKKKKSFDWLEWSALVGSLSSIGGSLSSIGATVLVNLSQGFTKFGPRATARPATHYIRTARDELDGPRGPDFALQYLFITNDRKS